MEILVCVKRVPTVGGKIALTPDGATLLYPWNDTLVSRGTTDLATLSLIHI